MRCNVVEILQRQRPEMSSSLTGPVESAYRSAVPDDVFVRLAGTGAPLVLLHGLLVNGEMFDPVVPLWSGRYRLIVPDLRGHGRSAALPGPYAAPRLASDI